MAIPVELISFNQWCVAKREDKIPLGANLKPINVQDESNFMPFEQANEIAERRHLSLGFILTKNDPFVIIDLDKTSQLSTVQAQILSAFQDTYIERSISMNGFHIIAKGRISKGIRRQNVEMYDDKRYFIITGNRVNNNDIIDKSSVIEELYTSMADGHNMYVNYNAEQLYSNKSDDEVLQEVDEMYGDEFGRLYEGDWEPLYPSQSEADMALINKLCTVTQSDEQVYRIFKGSALGARQKADNIHYVMRTIAKIRINDRRAEAVPVIPREIPKLDLNVEWSYKVSSIPNGLIASLTDFLLKSSVRPVYEIALIAAIALMAGITGRAFNISNTGLNLYLILLAATGTGKEHIATGIDIILDNLRPHIPSVDAFLGPKHFASGQALFKHMSKNPTCVSVLGEFGYTLQSLVTDSGKTPHLTTLKVALLDLYQKSGKMSVLKPSVYASDENRVASIQAPALTLVGESTPAAFFDAINTQSIIDGLLPRFSIIEYTGDRPERNKNVNTRLDEHVKSVMRQLADISVKNIATKETIDVQLEPKAADYLDDFDVFCDNKIRKSNENQRQLWNRSHLKALKIASLLSLGNGDKLDKPLITLEMAEWAVAFAIRDVETINKVFSNKMFTNANRFSVVIKDICKVYAGLTVREKIYAGVSELVAKDTCVIPKSFIRKNLRDILVSEKTYSQSMLTQIIRDAEEDRVLVPLDKTTIKKKYKATQDIYTIGDGFDENKLSIPTD